jgi:eukaryotic-like serine/threonine-protein kinase
VFVCPKCRSIYSTESEFCGIDGTRLEETDEDPLIGLEIDRYCIVSRLGTGAMGCVYLAEHKLLESKRAFKLLYGELAADRRAMYRFQREAQALSKIRHPNIVSIVDFGTTPDGLTFLAMEYIEGETLEDRMEAGEKLSNAWIASVARQVSAGLAEAHKLGFVHRDLKPGNVMVTRYDDVEQVKVLDFGLVAIADEAESVTRLTKTGYTLGTPRYLAPEQSQSAEVTSSADLYSLGVILYEMIAGRAPFVGDMKTVIMQHLCEAPPALPPSEGLEILALSLLEKDPAHRPESAASVVTIIDELAGKITGSDAFLALRTLTDPRGSLAPRRASTPGMKIESDGETLDKLYTSSSPSRPQSSWAPQLPLNDPAASMTGPSMELISQFPKGYDDRLIRHPKKILAAVVLSLCVTTVGLYIANELGWFRAQALRNTIGPIHVARPKPVKRQAEVAPAVAVNEPESQKPTSAALPGPKVIARKVVTEARAPSRVQKPAPARAPVRLTAAELKSLQKSLRAQLSGKGLKLRDLSSLPNVNPFYQRWTASANQTADAARTSHKTLARAVAQYLVDVSILQKRLKEVHASLVRSAEKKGSPEELARFEEEYLSLDGQARSAAGPVARQRIAVKVLALEREIDRSTRK